MTRAQIRRKAYDSLTIVDWLDTHAAARNPRDAKQLEYKLIDLRRAMLKIIDTYVRESDLNAADEDTLHHSGTGHDCSLNKEPDIPEDVP